MSAAVPFYSSLSLLAISPSALDMPHAYSFGSSRTLVCLHLFVLEPSAERGDTTLASQRRPRQSGRNMTRAGTSHHSGTSVSHINARVSHINMCHCHVHVTSVVGGDEHSNTMITTDVEQLHQYENICHHISHMGNEHVQCSPYDQPASTYYHSPKQTRNIAITRPTQTASTRRLRTSNSNAERRALLG